MADTSRLGGVRAAHLAAAFVLVARADHYMVEVVPTYTDTELDQAEQRLIDRQNDETDEAEHAALEVALDLIGDARRARTEAAKKAVTRG